MANPRHLSMLRKGVEAWNRWRKKRSGESPDLSGLNLVGLTFQEADLNHVNFHGTDLGSAVLYGADLGVADLRHANLSAALLTDANLTNAYLFGAKFIGARLDNAKLYHVHANDADFRGADLHSALLYGAELQEANLAGAGLYRANLEGAMLQSANLNGANCDRADFSYALMLNTIITNVDLSGATGLGTTMHWGPSRIGIDTLYKSRGRIPKGFLREAGVPEKLIEQLPLLTQRRSPARWHSCFISYSAKDVRFARRLYSRMREAGLHAWFALEDLKGGERIYDQVDRAIQFHDRLLLILSPHSIHSEWVTTEIRKAREVEKKENRRKLFPIRLCDFNTLRNWACFDSDTGKDLAVEIREYAMPNDFSNWKDHDAFEAAFTKLLKDLKAEEAKPKTSRAKRGDETL